MHYHFYHYNMCIDWMWKWKSILTLDHHLPPDKVVKLGVRGVVIVAFFFRKNTPPTQDKPKLLQQVFILCLEIPTIPIQAWI